MLPILDIPYLTQITWTVSERHYHWVSGRWA